jgi:hypothetical protein
MAAERKKMREMQNGAPAILHCQANSKSEGTMAENPDQPRHKVIVPHRTIPIRRIAGIAAIIVALVAVLYFFAVGEIRSHRVSPTDSAPHSGMVVTSVTNIFTA